MIVSLLLCCIGFKRFVWFMSVGYGLSVAGIGVALLVMSIVRGQSSLIYAVQCIVMAAYGIRLGGFVLVRERKNANYRAKLEEVGGNAKVPVFAEVFIWLYCGFLYIMQSAGPVYRLLNGFSTAPNAAAWIGTLISICGAVMEGLADKQKSAQKKTNPNMPAMEGLFRLCRCPNYFGEMLFWTGSLVSGIGALQGAQWIAALIGWCVIIAVMLSGAKRMETRHIRHYGNDSIYNEYADHTPLLIPFVPLYHMTTPEKVARDDAAKAAQKKK